MTTSDKLSEKKIVPPPDNRLAKVFNFTTADLFANRAGYLSRKQMGFIEFFNQWLLNGLYKLLGKGEDTPNFRMGRVTSACGRAHLKHTIVDRVGPRSTLFYEYYNLTIEGKIQSFVLTAPQFRALNENILYRVYFRPNEPKHILSIERVIGGCES